MIFRRTQDYLNNGVPEGQRNDSLMNAACQLRDERCSFDEAVATLLPRARAADYPRMRHFQHFALRAACLREICVEAASKKGFICRTEFRTGRRLLRMLHAPHHQKNATHEKAAAKLVGGARREGWGTT
jgi:hypothetical protein